MAVFLLQETCRSDPEHPESQVHSLYFDTADLEDYHCSEEGFHERRKIRIRWYGDQTGQTDSLPVFVELKTKKGFWGDKKRRQLSVPAGTVTSNRLKEGIVKRSKLAQILLEFGVDPDLPLKPIVLISYHRRRLREMTTGIRVSLDSEIRSVMIASDLGYGENALALHGGVIETKGPELELPATLRSISLLHTEWSRFSKYGCCIDAHLSPPGSVGRLWPSGILSA